MKKTYALRVVFAVLLAAWMIAIFAFSAQDATESSLLSRGITYKAFCAFYPSFEELSAERQAELMGKATFLVRKAAHFIEYAILGALSFLTVFSYQSISFRVRNVTAIGISVLYSVSDEIHQAFVPGRACRFLDIIIDSAGAIAAITLLAFFFVKRRKRNG